MNQKLIKVMKDSLTKLPRFSVRAFTYVYKKGGSMWLVIDKGESFEWVSEFEAGGPADFKGPWMVSGFLSLEKQLALKGDLEMIENAKALQEPSQ
ncbi:MAG: hypothetical protein MJA28_06370 [Gammaproteobacteria bacterium]|nr:hypothetical protein [Gammaproteobacteria bacterium]